MNETGEADDGQGADEWVESVKQEAVIQKNILHQMQLISSTFYNLALGPAKQTLECHFLQLPVEIMIDLVKLLPPHCQVLLSQTCSAMRTVVSEFVLWGRSVWVGGLVPEQRLEYLFWAARTMPEKWVCNLCVKLHEMVEDDTPAAPACRDSCPFGVRRLRELSYGLHGFNINHRHLEFTLKHTRLATGKSKHQAYLRRLVSPYHAPIKPGNTMDDAIVGQFSAYPKVVAGRYLLYSIRSFHQAVHGNLSQEAMGFLTLCKHQHTKNYKLFVEATRAQVPRYSVPIFRDRNRYEGPGDRLNKAILEAIETKPSGTEIFGSCTSCATDFSVQTSFGCAVVRAWQDLGPGGPLTEPHWRAMVDPYKAAIVAHKPGSIRESYGCRRARKPFRLFGMSNLFRP